MKSMHFQISNKQNSYTRILLYVSVPAVIAMLLFLIIFISYINNYKTLLKNAYKTQLEQFCSKYDIQLQSISMSFRSLDQNDDFIRTVDGFGNSSGDINSAQKILRRIAFSYSFIDSIVIVERMHDNVYTPDSIYAAPDYFNNRYAYADYDYSFWRNYKAPLSEKCILTPSNVYTDSNQKLIVPIVYTRVGNSHLNNYIIVNVDLSQIISSFNENKLSKNSTLKIASKPTRTIYDESFQKKHMDDDILGFLLEDRESTFDYKIDGKKHYLISYQAKKSILGYSYIAAIPYSDIYSSSAKLISILSLILLSLLVAISYLVLLSTRKIYSPLQTLANLFKTRDSAASPENLQNMIEQTLRINQNMRKELDTNLPLIEEQYLIRLLNSCDHYYTDDAADTPIHFKYNYFCSVIMRFNMTSSFKEHYDLYQTQLIEASLFNIIRSAFADSFNSYVIPSDEHTLYILLNLDSDTYTEQINSILDNFSNSLETDKNDIELSMSVGSIKTGINGLRQSHTEALNKLSGTTWMNRIQIAPQEDIQTKPSFELTAAEETMIYNHLTSGNTDEALKIIDGLFDNNSYKNLSVDNVKRGYVQLFNIIFKILRIKKIQYDNDDIGDIQLISNIIANPVPEIHDTMLNLIGIIKKHSEAKKIDISYIISYIQEHYKEDIYLELLAEHFHTSSSYLSRLIKQETSVTFSQYLNTLRIEEAKHLLLSTTDSITDIYTNLGFNNRSTFIRTFKNIVGVTPSEFRKTSEA